MLAKLGRSVGMEGVRAYGEGDWMTTKKSMSRLVEWLSLGVKVILMVWLRLGSRPVPEKASMEVLMRMEERLSTTIVAAAVECLPGMNTTEEPWNVKVARGTTVRPWATSVPCVVVTEPLNASHIFVSCLEEVKRH